MKIISHRGNIHGPCTERENEPAYVDEAIAAGFDVEIDVRYIDGKFYLGHDDPDYEVDIHWLLNRKNRLLVHCKNLEAACRLATATALKCFCSISDPFCFVTQDYLWLNDVTIEPTKNTIVPLLNLDDLERYRFMGKPWGVCTDYPTRALRL
jgi:hypothetical protein